VPTRRPKNPVHPVPVAEAEWPRIRWVARWRGRGSYAAALRGRWNHRLSQSGTPQTNSVACECVGEIGCVSVSLTEWHEMPASLDKLEYGSRIVDRMVYKMSLGKS
jgi:hypothetical protein